MTADVGHEDLTSPGVASTVWGRLQRAVLGNGVVVFYSLSGITDLIHDV